MACRLPILDLTLNILSFLQPLLEKWSSDLCSSALKEPLGSLPTEGINLICQHLQPFQDPSLQCSRDLAPVLWRELLFNRDFLPLL
jgi:hypothetical protein